VEAAAAYQPAVRAVVPHLQDKVARVVLVLVLIMQAAVEAEKLQRVLMPFHQPAVQAVQEIVHIQRGLVQQQQEAAVHILEVVEAQPTIY
jgi:hypothetical protein